MCPDVTEEAPPATTRVATTVLRTATPPNARSPIFPALGAALAIATVAPAAELCIADAMLRRSAILAGACLALWLTEAIPLYATTLVLWSGTVLMLGPLDAKAFSLPAVLRGAAN